MGSENNVTMNKKELEEMVLAINSKVGEYIHALKHRSSEEILNGSILEAQNIINQILPIETEFKKLDECQNSFLNTLRNNSLSSGGKSSHENSEKGDLDKLDLSEMDFTSSELYRVPILKALIYLGGNAKLSDVSGFIEKEMKNKFKKADHEKGTNGFGKLWIEMVNREKENMVKEKLISEDKNDEQWEIIQNGIDYLAQHAN
ncbi:MAG: hypothetical protein PF445_12505 [Melioribacteraceae bacterium]|jgi:hypothetical protein|nr:hypothetical protein [Melioribacteraceae bacterium]